MTWHVLVDVRASVQLPAGLGDAVQAHPLVEAASVHAPAPPPSGWRRALAAFGSAKAPSLLVAVRADGRGEAERLAVAAVESALAQVGVDGAARSAGAFRR